MQTEMEKMLEEEKAYLAKEKEKMEGEMKNAKSLAETMTEQ
jgi:hypothetical protein